jgi:hypothetical protein
MEVSGVIGSKFKDNVEAKRRLLEELDQRVQCVGELT